MASRLMRIIMGIKIKIQWCPVIISCLTGQQSLIVIRIARFGDLRVKKTGNVFVKDG